MTQLVQLPLLLASQPQPIPIPIPNVHNPPPPLSSPSSHINLAVGITLGLLASFIQSLGLTIQRKSHLQNDRLPFHLRKPDYARPIWVLGFVIYFTFNILGSIFQIGTLPLIILGPLGAISLLWNAILAKILLSDIFSYHLIFGTLLIGAGAVLIGFFGVLPGDVNHNLKELIVLYSRIPFVVEMLILILTLSLICLIAHVYEFKLNRHLRASGLRNSKGNQDIKIDSLPTCRKSPLHRLPDRPQSNQTIHGVLVPHRHPRDPFRLRPRRARSLSDPDLVRRAQVDPSSPSNTSITSQTPSQHELLVKLDSPDVFHDAGFTLHQNNPTGIVTDKHQQLQPFNPPNLPPHVISRTKLLIGVAYGSTSGTLSGICLLFAKTGVELLILTLSGSGNQFSNVETWLILLILLVAAILQLWYLNKALKLVNPTLICPLAFCFYNLSSIVSSLVYYDQFKFLSGLQIGLITLGTVVLLAGVWIVSLGTSSESTAAASSCATSFIDDAAIPINEATPLLASTETFEGPTLTASPAEMDFDDRSEAGRSAAVRELTRQMSLPSERRHQKTVNQLIRRFLAEEDVQPVLGFSIGLGAASPGFAIQPSQRRSGRRHSCQGSILVSPITETSATPTPCPAAPRSVQTPSQNTFPPFFDLS